MVHLSYASSTAATLMLLQGFFSQQIHGFQCMTSYAGHHRLLQGRTVATSLAVAKTFTASNDISISAADRTEALDWSFLDEVYLITCPNADPGGERVGKTKKLLDQVGLLDRVEIKEFATDDEDRIRGCYTSHLSVLKDAEQNAKKVQTSDLNPLSGIMRSFWKDSTSNQATTEPIQKYILVLEDNVALAGPIKQEMIDAVAEYCRTESWDIVHLSYIPYVPDLVISKTESDKIVKLSTGGLGSALGTTAYIINTDAARSLVEEDEKHGFYAPIPDVMAKLFPTSRYAANPIMFVRAPNTKSLVNPQLDDLRQLLFQPAVAAFAQNLLIISGMSTNSVLQLVVASLLIATIGSATLSFNAVMSILNTGTFNGPIIVPILSSLFTVFALAVIAQGALLAPKPPTEAEE